MTVSDPYAVINQIFDKARQLDAPLNTRLALLAEAVDEGAPEFAVAVRALIARLAKTGLGAQAPAVGEPLPPFIMPDQTGRLVSLTKLLQRGPLVVSFLRGHWCPYCRLTAFALADIQDAVGAEHMVAIMPETPGYSAAFRETAGLSYPILTDADCGYALSLNLAFFMDPHMIGLLQAIGQDLSLSQAGIAWVLPIPATFVLDSRGIVVARHVDPDYRRRMDLDDLIAAFEGAG